MHCQIIAVAFMITQPAGKVNDLHGYLLVVLLEMQMPVFGKYLSEEIFPKGIPFLPAVFVSSSELKDGVLTLMKEYGMFF